jgi:Transglycosylase SLT domain
VDWLMGFFQQLLTLLGLAPQAPAVRPTATPAVRAPVAAAPRVVATTPKPVSFIEYLRGEIKVLPTQDILTRPQVERIAQEITRRYFPRVDWRMLVTMAWVESSFNPNAYRFESHLDDASYGLLQTLLKNNALWMYQNRGATAMGRPDQGTLRDPIVSIYFGAAYVNWLMGQNTSPEWVVRAYNGGPGWKRSARGQTMTLNHWNKYKQARRQFYG